MQQPGAATTSLSGLRVVELAGLAPSQALGMLLADHGADVLVVEPTPNTDRGQPAIPGDVNSLCSRGKRSGNGSARGVRFCADGACEDRSGCLQLWRPVATAQRGETINAADSNRMCVQEPQGQFCLPTHACVSRSAPLDLQPA